MHFTSLPFQPATGWACAADPHPLDGLDTLVMLFGPASALTDTAALAPLRRHLPHSCWMAAAAPAIVAGRQAHDDGLSATVVRFDRTRVRRFQTDIGPDRSETTAARHLAAALADSPGLAAVLVMVDALQVDGPALVEALVAALPAGLPVAGGLGGDGTAAAGTGNDGTPQGSVCVIGLYGAHVHMARACRGGSIGFGPRRLVTRSEGQTVLDIDAQPALTLYREYLGRYADGLPEAASHFPLTVFRHGGDHHGVIRYVLDIDPARQSIRVAGDIPTGSQVQLSRAGRSELLDGAEQAARQVAPRLPADRPVLNLVVSCVGRRHVLGEQTEDELEPFDDHLPDGSLQVGFYSFGEISSIDGQRCEMHNMTFTAAALWED
jgi:hypothetical protein